jgi:hypothetical protein
MDLTPYFLQFLGSKGKGREDLRDPLLYRLFSYACHWRLGGMAPIVDVSFLSLPDERMRAFGTGEESAKDEVVLYQL